MSSKGFRIFLHVLFWLLAFQFFNLYYGRQEAQIHHAALIVPLLTCASIVFTYSMFYLVLPRFLFNPATRSIRNLGIVFLFLLVFMFYVDTMIIYGFFYHAVLFGPPVGDNTTDIYFVTLGIFFVPLVAIVIKIMKHWYREQKNTAELKHEKMAAELKQLKSQINPHFLFNTLNSLYSLALKKSDQAPEAILKLSGILSYLLYECKSERVTLEKEIKLLEDYISLERLRFGDRLDLRFEHPDPELSVSIPPMLLLPFVENSFKHSVSKQRSPVSVNMHIETTDKNLIFNIRNNIPKGSAESSTGGIGIENVRKRLELLFDQAFQLEIRSAGDFSVHLSFPVEHEENDGHSMPDRR